MRYIHTSIVSRHLATRGNNKILRTFPPHISSSEERLPRLTRRSLAQLRTKNLLSSNHTYTKSRQNTSITTMPVCNIHTHDIHHLFNCIHIRTTLSPLDLWTDPAGVTALLARWTEKLAGGPQAGTIGLPPLARVMGVGRQTTTRQPHALLHSDFQTQPFARSEDCTLNRSLEVKVQRAYRLRYGSYA